MQRLGFRHVAPRVFSIFSAHGGKTFIGAQRTIHQDATYFQINFDYRCSYYTNCSPHTKGQCLRQPGGNSFGDLANAADEMQYAMDQ